MQEVKVGINRLILILLLDPVHAAGRKSRERTKILTPLIAPKQLNLNINLTLKSSLNNQYSNKIMDQLLTYKEMSLWAIYKII